MTFESYTASSYEEGTPTIPEVPIGHPTTPIRNYSIGQLSSLFIQKKYSNKENFNLEEFLILHGDNEQEKEVCMCM